MPSTETISRALELIAKGPAQYDYFFDNLDDPSWIKPLLERGFFTSPPPPIVSGEGAMHPYWSESQFLLRMAERAPGDVADAVKAIPETENVRVTTDICRIGVALPAPLRLEIGKRVRTVTRGRPIFFLLPEAIGELIAGLASDGDSKFALHFAAEFLELTTPTDEGALPPRPTGRVDSYEYERLVRELIPGLASAAGLQAVDLGLDLLQGTIEARGKRELPRDYSDFWRQAIEDEPDHHGADVSDGLVAAIRDASLRLIDEGHADLATVAQHLRARGWHIFTRIALYLTAARVDSDPSFARQFAVDPAILLEGPLDHERDQLLATVSGRLDESELAAYLKGVESGPPIPVSEDPERDRQRSEIWRRDRLTPLKDRLPERWALRLKKLTERYGEPPPGGFRITTGYWSGPTSPVSEEEMAAMPAGMVIDFVAGWTPEETMRRPTAEGLARVLRERVKSAPKEFGSLVEKIVGLDPTYVRAVLDGLEAAAKDGQDLPWPESLTLAELPVSGPALDETPDQREREDRDPDWRWARKQAASLLEAALQNDLLPLEFARRTWETLHSLSWDSEPDPGYERRYGGTNMDPLTLSLNTTRGEAMHAVVAYAMWARRHDDSEGTNRALANLAEHLDPLAEPSLTIRGVFGARLHQLHVIAPEWVTEKVDLLFPPQGDLQRLRLATWDTFVQWGRPSPSLFAVLEQQYRAAVEELPIGNERTEEARKDPAAALAEHLATFVWWGTVGAEEGGLAESFFKAAEANQAAHLLQVLGRSLGEKQNQPIAPEVIVRVEALWTALPTWVDGRAREEQVEILSAFGELYASAVFDEEWADEELMRLAAAGVLAGAEYVIFDRLVARASVAAEAPLRFALAFVESPPKPWSVDAHRKDLGAIVEIGLTSSERELAEQLVNQLVSKGHRQFRDFLDDKAKD